MMVFQFSKPINHCVFFLYRDTINVNGVDERSYIDYQSNKKIFSKDSSLRINKFLYAFARILQQETIVPYIRFFLNTIKFDNNRI